MPKQINKRTKPPTIPRHIIFKLEKIKDKEKIPGAPGWLSQLSVLLLVSAQVMISQFMSSRPVLGSVLTARSPLGILSLPLSLPLPYSGSLSLSLRINKYIKTLKKNNKRKTQRYLGIP